MQSDVGQVELHFCVGAAGVAHLCIGTEFQVAERNGEFFVLHTVGSDKGDGLRVQLCVDVGLGVLPAAFQVEVEVGQVGKQTATVIVIASVETLNRNLFDVDIVGQVEWFALGGVVGRFQHIEVGHAALRNEEVGSYALKMQLLDDDFTVGDKLLGVYGEHQVVDTCHGVAWSAGGRVDERHVVHIKASIGKSLEKCKADALEFQVARDHIGGHFVYNACEFRRGEDQPAHDGHGHDHQPNKTADGDKCGFSPLWHTAALFFLRYFDLFGSHFFVN